MDQDQIPSLNVDWVIRPQRIDPLHIVGKKGTEVQTREEESKKVLKAASTSTSIDPPVYHVDSPKDDSSIPLRRTRSLPSTEPAKKKGFFRSLFGIKSKASEKKHSNTVSHKEEKVRSEELHDQRRQQHHKSRQRRKSISVTSGNSLIASEVEPARKNEDLSDMKLTEFIKFYKENGCSFTKVAKNERNRRVCFVIDDEEEEDDELSEEDESDKGTEEAKLKKHERSKARNQRRIRKSRVDLRGRPLPWLPAKSANPSCFKHKQTKKKLNSQPSHTNDQGIDQHADNSEESLSNNRFGTFLKKVTSHSISVPPTTVTKKENTKNNDKQLVDIEKNISTTTVPGLEDFVPLKRVSFASSTYFNDPPQQICSKNPRMGEVEVTENGEIVIHKLSAEEKQELMKSTDSGVVVGGSGSMRMIAKLDEEEEKEIKVENRRRNQDIESDEDGQESISGSQSRESTSENESFISGDSSLKPTTEQTDVGVDKNGPSLSLQPTTTNNEEEVPIGKSASVLTIDKPMLSRRSTGFSSSMSLISMMSESSFEGDVFPPRNIKIPLDVIYTRCCHLREILPIPATLKQLKKGSFDPIPLLQLRNPKPSTIEVLAFSDFICIAPILCVSIDGVSLSAEMLRTILGSLINKSNFEKLSMRNTVLDEEGWKSLCYFISKSKSLVSIDLTMVASIKTNVQKPSKASLLDKKKRMVGDLNSRSAMNWNLFTAATATRGGLEEIVISGAKMPFLPFKNFIEVACAKVERLGLAYNDLTKEQVKFLADWVFTSNVLGLDLGFNDLNGKLKSLSKALWKVIETPGQSTNIKYISLNCTNMEVEKDATSQNNNCLKLISTLCYCDTLKFLDLSNNPKMFPHCIRTLLNCLPVFISLVRLHLDHENIDSTSVIMLTEALPMCSNLNHLSLLGTKFDLAATKALTESVKKSSTLITLDFDRESMPQESREKISLLTMRNVQNYLTSCVGNENVTSDSKGSQLMNLQERLSKLLSDKTDNSALYKQNIAQFIHKLVDARSKITKVVHDLFDLRLKNELNKQGKETLIRLCFIDSCFEKGIRLLKERYPDVEIKLNSQQVVPDGISTVPEDYEPENLAQTNEDLATPAVISSTSFEQSGHSILLPFGKVEVEDYSPDAYETVDLTEEKDLPAAYAEQLQNTEEARVFKKSANIVKELEENAADRGMQLNKRAITEAAETLDSTQIKDLLLEKDISATVSVIDELHNQGYHLHNIFKRKSDTCPVLSQSKSLESSFSDSQMDHNNEQSPGMQVSQNQELTTDVPHEQQQQQEDHAMDLAYDEVLDNLMRARSFSFHNRAVR